MAQQSVSLKQNKIHVRYATLKFIFHSLSKYKKLTYPINSRIIHITKKNKEEHHSTQILHFNWFNFNKFSSKMRTCCNHSAQNWRKWRFVIEQCVNAALFPMRHLGQIICVTQNPKQNISGFCAKLSDCYVKMEKHSAAYEKYELCVTFFTTTSNRLNTYSSGVLSSCNFIVFGRKLTTQYHIFVEFIVLMAPYLPVFKRNTMFLLIIPRKTLWIS